MDKPNFKLSDFDERHLFLEAFFTHYFGKGELTGGADWSIPYCWKIYDIAPNDPKNDYYDGCFLVIDDDENIYITIRKWNDDFTNIVFYDEVSHNLSDIVQLGLMLRKLNS